MPFSARNQPSSIKKRANEETQVSNIISDVAALSQKAQQRLFAQLVERGYPITFNGDEEVPCSPVQEAKPKIRRSEVESTPMGVGQGGWSLFGGLSSLWFGQGIGVQQTIPSQKDTEDFSSEMMQCEALAMAAACDDSDESEGFEVDDLETRALQESESCITRVISTMYPNRGHRAVDAVGMEELVTVMSKDGMYALMSDVRSRSLTQKCAFFPSSWGSCRLFWPAT